MRKITSPRDEDREPETTSLSVTVPTSLHDAALSVAGAKGVSVDEMVTVALALALPPEERFSQARDNTLRIYG